LAKAIKVGLSESMSNGAIIKCQQFLGRLTGVPGVHRVQVTRGPAVIVQFGPGLASRQIRRHCPVPGHKRRAQLCDALHSGDLGCCQRAQLIQESAARRFVRSAVMLTFCHVQNSIINNSL